LDTTNAWRVWKRDNEQALESTEVRSFVAEEQAEEMKSITVEAMLLNLFLTHARHRDAQRRTIITHSPLLRAEYSFSFRHFVDLGSKSGAGNTIFAVPCKRTLQRIFTTFAMRRRISIQLSPLELETNTVRRLWICLIIRDINPKYGGTLTCSGP
jgi:hypothetical protein